MTKKRFNNIPLTNVNSLWVVLLHLLNSEGGQKLVLKKKKKTGFDIHFKDRAQNKIFETYPLDTWKTITEKTISFKKVQIWMIFLSSKLKIGKRIKA